MTSWVLEARNITRVVQNTVVLSDISFTISQKDILFVRGPSGVGKSLMLRALAGLDSLQVTRPAACPRGVHCIPS